MFIDVMSSLVLIPLYIGWIVCVLALPVLLLLPFIAIGVVFGSRYLEAHKVLEHNDKTVKEIEVIDDGSDIISFGENFPELGNSDAYGRRHVGELLVVAQKSLPAGCYLKVLLGYQSFREELNMEKLFFSEQKNADPNIPAGFLIDQRKKMRMEFRLSGHNTGGAVDVTLTDDSGSEMDLGEKHTRCTNWLGKKLPSLATKQALGNRKILSDAMKRAGFVQYETEWWHWSFGDSYWCAATGAAFAFYGMSI